MSCRQLPGVDGLKHPPQGEHVAHLKMEGSVRGGGGAPPATGAPTRLNPASKAARRRRQRRIERDVRSGRARRPPAEIKTLWGIAEARHHQPPLPAISECAAYAG